MIEREAAVHRAPWRWCPRVKRPEMISLDFVEIISPNDGMLTPGKEGNYFLHGQEALNYIRDALALAEFFRLRAAFWILPVGMAG